METKPTKTVNIYRSCNKTSCGKDQLRYLASTADLDELTRVSKYIDSIVSKLLSCGVAVDLGTPDLQTRIKNVCDEIKDYPVFPVKE